MYFLNQICYICMKHKNTLKQLFLNNCENEEYSKLISSVPEMCFKELEEHGMICVECCTKLDDAHRFREKCLRSKQLILDYISKQRSDSETSSRLNVCVQDYKNLFNIPMTNNEHLENTYYNTDKIFKMSNSNYIVTADAFIDNRDGNSLSVKTEAINIENQAGSNDTDEAVGEIYIDHTSPGEIGAIIKNKIVIKTEPEDMSNYEVKTESNYPTHREREYSESNCAALTQDMLNKKINSDSIVTEEFDIKFEQEDIVEYGVDKLETTPDEITEITRTLGKKHATDMGPNFIKEKRTSENRFECEQCGKIFARKNTLISHKIIHTDEKPFRCDHCGKSFSQNGHLIGHIRSHTGEKPFRCEYCDKMFALGHQLTAHIRIHTGEKRFKCEHCDKMFTLSHQLTAHIRTHTGEKPFRCDCCDKKFSKQGSLIVHKRTHTGEKPFRCELCDKMFAQKCNLIVHRRTHTGEKPFACDQCENRFAVRSVLIRHKRIHTR